MLNFVGNSKMTKNISGVVASDGMNLPRKKKKNSKEDSVKYTGQKKLIQDGLKT